MLEGRSSAEIGKQLFLSAKTVETYRSRMMRKLGIPEPESGMASTLAEALVVAGKIGYPLIVRPSFVLGGRAMQVVHDAEMLETYMHAAVDVSPERPILIEKFLDNAIEAEADAICDGTDAFVLINVRRASSSAPNPS